MESEFDRLRRYSDYFSDKIVFFKIAERERELVKKDLSVAFLAQGSNQVSLFFSVVARMFAPSVGTMMDGEHAFATSGGTAWRRRPKRLRAFRRYVLWHSKMEIAAALHHTSRQRTSTTTAATQRL